MSRKSSRRGSREARFGRGLKTALAVFAVVVCMFIGGSTFFTGHGSHVSADNGRDGVAQAIRWCLEQQVRV